MALRFRFRRQGMPEILNSRKVRDDMEARARRVAQEAKSRAPVRTGAYRDSITVRTVRTDRQVGRAYADVPYASQVEARHRVLGRSIDAARG